MADPETPPEPKVDPNKQLGWNAAVIAVTAKSLEQVYLSDPQEQAEINRARQILMHLSRKLSAQLLGVKEDDEVKH